MVSSIMTTNENSGKDAVQHTETTARVLEATSGAAEFEAEQHALSRTEAIKMNVKPLAWCKS
jgi:hypothetical protein